MKQSTFTDLSTVSALLAFVAALPYEKDFMMLIPSAYAPKVALISGVAAALLRLLPTILGIFKIRIEK